MSVLIRVDSGVDLPNMYTWSVKVTLVRVLQSRVNKIYSGVELFTSSGVLMKLARRKTDGRHYIFQYRGER